jgi:putative hemolysin
VKAHAAGFFTRCAGCVQVPSMTVTATHDLAVSGQAHIVDTLIEERAPKLARSLIWPILRPALYAALSYAKARRMADDIQPMPGQQALEYVSDLLALKLKVSGLENVPETGRVILLANHPTGIGDGIAVWDALKGRRPDTCFYANSDAHRVCPRFDDVLVPVEWVYEKRTRERTRLTLKMTAEAMEAERALVVFPAAREGGKAHRSGMDVECGLHREKVRRPNCANQSVRPDVSRVSHL